jgi:hypothetical protein
MSKKLALFSILLVGVLAGCSLVPQLQQSREDYLETRVAELLTQMPTEEIMAALPEETEVMEATVVEEATATLEATEEVTEEPTAETTAEATAEVTEEPTAEATDEAKVLPVSTDPGVYLEEADWVDDMTEVGNWPTSTNDFNSASFDNGTLMITALSEQYGWRIATTDALGNTYIEASIKVENCSGTDSYGIIFRVPENTGYNRGYLFGITCDGRYALRSWDGLTGSSGVMKTLQEPTESALIKAGKLQTNRLGIMAIDDRLIMYINGEKVGEVSDNAYSAGYFGIYLNRDKTENLTIYVDDVKYWDNPTVQ